MSKSKESSTALEDVRLALRRMRGHGLAVGTSTTGGVYLQRAGRPKPEPVAPATLRAWADVAVERGWAEATDLGYADSYVRYTLTPAGRAEARVGEGLDELTIESARGLKTHELAEVWGDLPLARRQLELREAGGARIRGALVASGESHSGTGGWHLLPYVTPSMEIGYVDSARGRAYLTGVELDRDTVVSLTAPGQGPGPQASGAAAWSAPDAGRGGSTEAPTGWVQLFVDIRTHLPVAEVEARPRLVAYGLVTCYSHRRGAPPDDVQAWPLDGEQRARVHALADGWLSAAIATLAPLAPAPIEWSPETRDEIDARNSVRVAVAAHFDDGAARAVLRDAGAYRVARAADERGERDRVTYSAEGTGHLRRTDHLTRLLEEVLVDRVMPVWHALPAELRVQERYAERRAVARAVAEPVGRALLAEHAAAVPGLIEQCRAILYERGAIITPEGLEAGVECNSPPPRPVALRGEVDGREVYRVPFGAMVPEGFTHSLVLAVDHELRCRPEDAEHLTRAVLGTGGRS